MPQVPGGGAAQTYGPLRVGADPLPDLRRSSADSAESLGAGAALARARTAETVGEVGGAMARLGAARYAELVDRERAKADETAINSLQRRLGEWELKRLHDPDAGALSVRGNAASTLPETVLDEFDKFASELGAEANTDRQKLAYERLVLERRAHLDLTVRRHTLGEMQRYAAEELEGTINVAVQTAVVNALDPARVNLELGRAVDALKAFAAQPGSGIGPQQLAEKVLGVQTATHDGVIRRLLANGKDEAAAIYFEEAKGQISEKALPSLESAIKEGNAIGKAQKAVDRIISAGGTLTEQRAAIKAELTGRERELGLQMVEHEAAVRDRQTRETEEAHLRTAYDLLDKGRGIRDVMRLETWSGFSGNVRSALRNYAENLARGVPVQTDIATFYSLIEKAGKDPQGFASTNLLEFRHKLGETEFKQLAGAQLEVRKNNREAAAKILGGPQSALQVVNSALEMHGIATDPKAGSPEASAIAQLRGLVDRRVEDLQAITGKPATNQELRAIVDEALLEQTTKPGSRWNWLPFGKSPWDEETVRVVDVRSVRDIPTGTRTDIETRLKQRGMPITESVVLSIYREMLWNRDK